MYLGTIDQVPVGLLLMRIEELLPQAGGARVGAIHLVFVDHEAREVGVGETMRDQALKSIGHSGSACSTPMSFPVTASPRTSSKPADSRLG